MKSRKLFLYLTIVFATIAIGLYVVWKGFSVENRLKDYILSEVQPYFDGEVKVDELTLTPNSITLQKVSLDLPKQSIQLNVDRLQLGFSYYNALKYNFNPIRFISDIVLEKPVFRIIGNGKNTKSDESESPKIDLESLKKTYENTLVDINYIGKIEIDAGSVAWVDSLNVETLLVSNLGGWVSTKNLAKSNLRLIGKLFSSKKENVVLQGQANLLAGRIDSVLVSVYDKNLSTTIPTLFPDILRIDKGELKGHGILREKPNGRLTLDGSITITEADVMLFEEKVKLDHFNTQAKISDWNVELVYCNLNCYDSPFEISGNVFSIFSPLFDLTVHANQTDLERVYNEVWGAEKTIGLNGLADFKVQLTNTTKNPKFSGSVNVSKLGLFGEQFNSVKTQFNYQSGLFRIERARGVYQNLDFDSDGSISINVDNRNAALNFLVSGDLTKTVPKVLNKELASLPVWINGNLSTDFKEYAIKSNLNITGSKKDGNQINSINGDLSLLGDEITLSLICDENPFRLDAKLKPNKESFQFSTNFDNFGGDLWDIPNIPMRKQLKKLLMLSGEITGDQNYSTYTLNANRKIFTGESNSLFNISGVYSSNGNSQLQGDITYHPDTGGSIPGYIDLEFNSEFLNLKQYQLGDFYSADGRIDFSGNRNIDGRLTLTNADIIYILDGVFLNPSFGMLGQINGEIDFCGTLDSPEVESKLSFSDIIYKGEGYYSGDAEVDFSENELAIHNINLLREERSLLKTSGIINLRDEILNLEIKGEDTNIATVLDLFISNFNSIEGRGSFNLTIQDSIRNPDINGEITATNGWLYFVPFDSLKMQVGKATYSSQSHDVIASISTNGYLRDISTMPPGFYFSNAEIKKNEKYQIEGYGYLPFSSKRDMEIQLNGEGDALAILFSDMPEVLESESEAIFNWGFGGNYNDPIYTEGEVLLKNGRLKLEYIAPEIKNIQSTVKYVPENQFVSVPNLSGTIDKHKFIARTQYDSISYNLDKDPLFISSWKLNFGTIYFKTDELDETGVPLNIPGAMKSNETGRFVIKGKGDDEYFTITGPEEHPVSTGEIFVNNAGFLFPFEYEEPVSPEPSLTEKILESMVWDVHVVPLKDVWYVSEFPGVVDNIRINASIDPISDLTFSGIFADETFRSEGVIQSTRGTIEYLDFNFGIEKFAAEFDKSDIFPIVYGRARTTYTDSVGIPSNIYLTMFTYDPETKQELERGRWDEDVRFRLSSDNPLVGSNEVQVLASLGYSVSTIRDFGEKARDVIGLSTENLFIRPLFRPVERKLEQTLGIDAIRFRSRFAKNILDLNSNTYNQIDPRHRRYLLFRSTELTIGKYLSENLFLLYSGQLEVGLDPIYQRDGVGLRHSLDLEYRIYPNLLLELQYNYDRLLLTEKDDKRIQIRHSFIF